MEDLWLGLDNHVRQFGLLNQNWFLWVHYLGVLPLHLRFQTSDLLYSLRGLQNFTRVDMIVLRMMPGLS